MKLLLLFLYGLINTSAEDAGSNPFIANVYKELSKSENGSFLFCPKSVEIALTLLQTGARGKTAQQISTALHLPETAEKVRETYLEMSSKLQGNKDYDLSNLNKIYVKKGFNINDEYKSTAVNVFKAEIQTIDFANSREAATEINKWVEEKTNNTIKNIMGEGSLTADTIAVLVNAMYFHGTWVKTFESHRTLNDLFFKNHNNYIDVDMMSQIERFNYHEDHALNAKFLQMPYKGNDVSMTVILPNSMDGLSSLETQIADILIEPKYEFVPVNVEVPKFQLETKIEYIPILKTLGIVDAFESSANFEGIISGSKHLQVDDVVQKTFIEVDEEGTIAAAATSVGMMLLSGTRWRNTKEFIADHPFIYYIKSPAGILFIGRYTG